MHFIVFRHISLDIYSLLLILARIFVSNVRNWLVCDCYGILRQVRRKQKVKQKWRLALKYLIYFISLYFYDSQNSSDLPMSFLSHKIWNAVAVFLLPRVLSFSR